MTKKLKVATIGGGSSYTPELIEGFIKRYDEFPLTELWLVDIEAGKEKLEIVGNLAKRMVKKAGLDIRIELTLDREEALKEADFVTTQFRVGLLEARKKDERIPLKYDVIGQETNGPGGLFKGLRTIPVILDITRDMERLCPDAWLINFTNPAGMVTEAVLRYSNIEKVVGLCNVPIGIEMGVSKLLDVDHSRVRIDFAGLNHMVYGLNVFLDGENVTKHVVEKLTDPEQTSFVKNIEGIGYDPSFIRALGVLTCPYHNYYYKHRDMLEKQQKEAKEQGTRAEVVSKLEKELFELYKDDTLDIKPPQLEERGGAYYSDAAVRLITSIYNDKRDIQPVNTRNNGAIASIPNDSAVEISSVITKDGPKPIAIGDLPVAVRGLVQQIKSFERISAEAAVTGDIDLAVLALSINPLTPSDTVAREIVDEMMEAHKDYLPQFFNK
ncbi:6-phospho-beta-glucosidase [Halolactibacillus halophilus]|uniref:6-phospho-beta-glucosidase n=1 Tax=Halolactibacillus halophilus TaxID=306540 RepID=A0A1I5T7M7_9BACI|nr:6-phospho-beta-glucosidase [Halolactibacillus halophilus]GEM02897.1 6-phospho-beta-glucosidase [Halolactibacillus halophilus]SFP79040.1 6-phospho-beta-glucosidase [Halolactibacillus halophilus]